MWTLQEVLSKGGDNGQFIYGLVRELEKKRGLGQRSSAYDPDSFPYQ